MVPRSRQGKNWTVAMFGLRATRFLTPPTLRPTLTLRLRAMASLATPSDFNKVLYAPLQEVDPEVQNLIDRETWRQFSGLELIASEVDLLIGFWPIFTKTHSELDQSCSDAS